MGDNRVFLSHNDNDQIMHYVHQLDAVLKSVESGEEALGKMQHGQKIEAQHVSDRYEIFFASHKCFTETG